MAQPRPIECPACGHERIERRPQRLRSETSTLRVRLTQWMCALCRYQWTLPAATVDDWEVA